MKRLNLVLVKQKGFTLIEVLTYILLLSCVIFAFFGGFNKALLNILATNSRQGAELELALACDILRRDLISASMIAKDWNVEQFVFRKYCLNHKNKEMGIDVCWYIGNFGLMRAEGLYDFAAKKWKSRSVCLVCKYVHLIELAIKIDEKFGLVCGAGSRILAKCGAQDKKLEEVNLFVKVRNRILQ